VRAARHRHAGKSRPRRLDRSRHGGLETGIFRQFSITELARLQFRSEFFNALNHTNLGSPSATVNAGAKMGTITSAGDARVIQFALKAIF